MNNARQPRSQILFCIPRWLSKRVLIAILTGMVSIGVLFATFVFLPKPQRARPKRLMLSEPFCCPNEALFLASTVNHSVQPCDDFYSYVCTASVMKTANMSTKLRQQLEAQITSKGAKGANVSFAAISALARSRSVVFLRELYGSCEAALVANPQRNSKGPEVRVYYAQMAEALLENEKDFLIRLTVTNFLAYLLTVNLKYQIHSVIKIDYESMSATFLIDHNALKPKLEVHEYFTECVWAALTAYNENKSISDNQHGASFRLVTFHDIQNFATRLHALYPKELKREVFVASNVSQLWPIESFTEALRTLPWIISSGAIKIVSTGAEQITVITREITNVKNWTVGAVYLVAHTIATAYLDLLREENAHSACLGFSTRLQHTVDIAYWELYGAPEKERVIQNSFYSVRDVISFEAASSLVSNEDEQAARRLSNLTSKLTLITAASRNISVREIPNAVTANFGRNFLLGRSFEFNARKNRADLGLPLGFSEENPVLHAGRQLWLEVPASFYGLVHSSKHPSPLNMAVLDVRLAELLWHAVLTQHWEGGRVEKLLRCFGGAYRQTQATTSQKLRLVVMSLALRSAVRAPSFQDWYKKFDSSGDTLSRMQLLFLKAAYERCPRVTELPGAHFINIPVAYSREFVRAFSCPHAIRTEQLSNCTL